MLTHLTFHLVDATIGLMMPLYYNYWIRSQLSPSPDCTIHPVILVHPIGSVAV